MNLKTFIFGLIVSFGVPFLLVVAIPFAKMAALEPVPYNEDVDEKTGYYQAKTNGLSQAGAQVYTENGCYHCHSRLVRPTYAGNDMFVAGLAGGDSENGFVARESIPQDYVGEQFVAIGLTRIGPDLANYGRRAIAEAKELGISPTEYVLNHLHNPQADDDPDHPSTCPKQPQMFDEVPLYSVQANADAIEVNEEEGYQLVPGDDAHAITSFLLSLRRDDVVPASISTAPAKGK